MKLILALLVSMTILTPLSFAGGYLPKSAYDTCLNDTKKACNLAGYIKGEIPEKQYTDCAIPRANACHSLYCAPNGTCR